MQGRLGVYEKHPLDLKNNTVDGVNSLHSRIQQAGGNSQQERMIKDKRRSLERALWHSYQGARIIKLDATDKTPFRALINPNKLKKDYDDKILSVGFEYEVETGTIFEWVGTNSFWLVYLQDLTELAYFRGDIRRCTHEIKWEDERGPHSTYIAVRGPVETKINFIQKHGISVDTPNHSLNILMPRNEDTLNYFKRYQKFYLQDDDTCWRVEATDWISTPGILEVTAVEYYANETEDDIENGVVGGLIEKIEDPNGEEKNQIIGETFIKPKMAYEFSFTGRESAVWAVDKNYPVKLTVSADDPRYVTLIWTGGYSGQFDLFYGEHSKTVAVESLF